MNPTDRELEILKVLWDIGEGSVRAVHEQMAVAGDPHFNTVQTQLRIMDRKGLVAHRRDGRTLIYRPLYSREHESSRFLKQVFNGSLDQLVLSMLSAERVKPETLDELEELIKDARKKGRSKKRSDND
ncbi:MAG TPA: BlaI/MecI/CopY family transcriptional regulator [Pirellulales bacterium]|jgi:predicted transcriptional regulator